MPQTTHLALPLIDAAQAQKHVTHNEALAMLDTLAHLCVAARNVTTAPASPNEGDRLLVGTGATGAFAGKDGQVAAYLAGGWTFLPPRPGWRAYVEAESLLLLYDDAAWVDIGAAIHELQNLGRLGIGTTADAANPLSAKINAALFAAKTGAEGGSGDLRLTLNKEGPTKTVSQLYQSNYSGRAETGLTGDDNFRVKVSANGSLWRDSVVVDCATGAVSFPSGGPTRVLAFATSGAYAPTPGLRFAEVILFGAGGGGGSGARQASGAIASGGGGGGGGGKAVARYAAEQIGASQTIVIGAGGAGGAAQTTDGAAGNAGAVGGVTWFGNLIRVAGGGGGAGGGLSAGSGGGGGGQFSGGASGSGAIGGAGGGLGLVAGAGGSATTAATVGAPGAGSGGGGGTATGLIGGAGGDIQTLMQGGTGGGAGGGITAANVVADGQRSGRIFLAGTVAGAGQSSGAGNPGLAFATTTGPFDLAGTGGGGGASSLTAPGAGGVGGFPGGGGGGGGASRNGADSGTGGAGANGYAIVIEYF